MSRGGAGNMLGVGGTRRNLGRNALRGGGRNGRVGGGLDPQAQKRELLRKLQEQQEQQEQQRKANADDEES
ncbi:DUF6243 family protein [Streptomyces lancefieldiae]|uniref:DUF6243 family protein n=1 Tax=Streptomyces lancefieldiae TaxID=3075520 RepID=A0ABU3AX40_9ACTN|nr:DUF6243 family protein [Streptomyces sp. DSM 40712]MDT0614757.1 DUF6243 family protein [Streptomyces sp. DSM 40712]